mmetsp:Transcript_95237/g.269165  ORF Transcript_95237/g.269165 Transcript_95237/m.269165 type:complete len:291 (+) Transcript_95237:87-959(+)|eukprot:CAMPEP_0117577372 /NCGR_PEP_ID=MMETSP0784-20121206/63383_1 /TAXON_ID=39447 /ORGANISM="" /LENGTH=290 /DNA_ID=CAMNT_0005376861 /DNA_START=81 /DNA_END=953 /DNA_ORIENTATION=+
MSRAVLESFANSFFPALMSTQKRLTPALYEKLFPPDVSAKCMPAQVGIGNITVRMPGVGLSALVGIGIGFLMARALFAEGGARRRLWAWSFFWFGMMNLDALVLHCFLDPTSPFRSTLWLVDCICTGNSSAALVVAALQEYAKRLKPSTEHVVLRGFRDTFQSTADLERVLLLTWLGFLLAGCISLHALGWTAPGEAIYLLPTAAAVVVLGVLHIGEPALLRAEFPAPLLLPLLVVALAMGLAFAFDGELCDALGSSGGEFLVSGFLGCDLLFVAIRFWLGPGFPKQRLH